MADATGGTITYSGGYTIHTFTSNGNFVVPGDNTVDYLIQAGGAGASGGTAAVNYGSGGAGGSIDTGSGYAVTAQTYAIVVGTGSAGVDASTPSNGGDSSFDGIVAGGGLAVSNASRTGGANDDFSGGTNSTGTDSGAGAGANQNGQTSVGGDGLQSSITGSAIYYGGGGGGIVSNVGQAGGQGGGGAGAASGGGVNGTDGLGGGGGGGSAGPGGGDGGDGVVIIRYLTGSFDKPGGNPIFFSQSFAIG
jgi:hypothetical protein